jgi:hypothetical protein
VTKDCPLSLSATDMEEKRREIIKERIDSGRIEETNSNVNSDKKVSFYPKEENN